MAVMLAEIVGWEFFAVIIVIALLFGGSQLPKLARSLGSAKSEFEKGLREGADSAKDDKADDKPAT
jgi:sec-independent protein translocase protein TatA